MLLALHLALTLPLTCAVAVSAEGETLTQGGTVAENTPFEIYLGDNFTSTSTVYVQIDKEGVPDSYIWSPADTDAGLSWDIENKVLTVSGDYIGSGTGSLAGMTLCDAVYDFMRTIGFDIRKNSDGSCTVLGWRTVGAADIVYAKCVTAGDGANTQHYIKYQIEGETKTPQVPFDPSQATGVCLSFASHPKLPTRPLEPGEYSHYLVSERLIYDTYAAVHYLEDNVYKSYNGSDVGFEFASTYVDDERLAKLKVEQDSVLDGAIFTGDEYVADMVTFTAADGTTKDLLVYESDIFRDPANEDRVTGYHYKCVGEDGEIADLVLGSENDYATLTYKDTYKAIGTDQYSVRFIMHGKVLFFESDKPAPSDTGNSSGSGDSSNTGDSSGSGVTPAPSYPKYYPDYDEPATVQPAPEAPEAETNEYIVVCRRLNVRRTPSTRYTRVGRISRGDVVNVVEWVGKWAKIEWKGGTAYVHGNYISPVD